MAAPGIDRVEGRRSPDRPLRRSLHAAVAEGACAEVFAACATGAVITGWAIHLGATPAVIGLLGALPLGAQVANLPTAWLVGSLSRKAVTLFTISVSRLAFVPLILLPFLPGAGGVKLRAFVAIVAISTVAGVVGNTAWVAWMGDLVPGRIRGRFFGRRMIFLSITGTVTTLCAAVLLDRAGADGSTGTVLALLAAVAGAAGLLSIGLLLAQYEPPVTVEATPVRLRALGHVIGNAKARPFLLYQLAWNAAVGISSSFFSYHLLTNLETGFLVIAAHGMVVATVRIGSASLWGRAVDQIGARPVLVFCSFGIAAVPLVWFLVTPERLWPIALEACTAGLMWAGHGIAAMHLSISLSPRSDRPFYVASFSTAGGLGYSVASTAAGQLAALFPATFMLGAYWCTSIHVLFLLSAIGRFCAAAFSTRIQDPSARGGVPELVRVLTIRKSARLLRE